MLDAHASRRVLPIALSCVVLLGCATSKAAMPAADVAAAARVQACADLGMAPDDRSCTAAWSLGYSDTWATYLGTDGRTAEAIASSLAQYSGQQLAAYDAGVQYARSLQR